MGELGRKALPFFSRSSKPIRKTSKNLSSIPPMQEIFVTLDDFLRHVSDLSGATLFRGISSASYGLRPSIGRIEIPSKDAYEIERTLLNRFKLKSQLYFKSEKELDWLIFARHFGLNTRILDWTRSHYVALYFALQNRSKFKHEPFSVIAYKNPKTDDYFKIRELDPFGLDCDVYIEPPNLDNRIANQQAFLSIHKNPFKDIDSLDLCKYSFYPTSKSLMEIEKQLLSVGIGHASIYPGPDGIAKHLNENPKPGTFGLHLETGGPSWQPINQSMIGRTTDEYRRLLLTEQLFHYILEFYSSRPQDLIGLPVIFETGERWFFHTYAPFEKKAIFLKQGGTERRVLSLDDSVFYNIKVDSSIINKLIPNELYVRRRISD
jgi:hypothetical protein